MNPELVELNEKARSDGAGYQRRRFSYEKIEQLLDERTFLGLVGPRGVGKTILLRQVLASRTDAFYISLDSVRLDEDLFSVAKEIEERGIRYLLLDEIHFLPDFAKYLKKIHDFLKIKVVFTSSCAISLHSALYDLSRRVRLLSLHPFSFREFLFFEKGINIPKFSLDNLFNQDESKAYYAKTFSYEPLFEAYLKGRLYPFTDGVQDAAPLFRSILDKVLLRDLFFTDDVSPEDARDMSSLIKFVGFSPAEDVSYSSISSNIGITKYKAGKYVSLLEKAFILNVVFPKGTNVLKEPKVLLALPYRLLYKPYRDCIGALREDFFVEAIRSVGADMYYLKTSRGRKTPDYLLQNGVIEIGGKGKGRTQFKGFKAKEKIILTQPGLLDDIRRPLFFAGMLC